MAEKDIEKKIVDHGKSLGLKCRKLNGLGYRDWPDRMFLGSGRKVLFMEVKMPGNTPTTLQTKMIGELNALGFRAVWVDTVEEGINELDRYFKKV